MKSKILFFSSYDNYLEKFSEFTLNDPRKICYVTLNKTHDYINSVLRSGGFENEIYFLDGIGKIFYSHKETENCDFVDPRDLDEVSENIVRVLKKGYNLIIVDLISDFYVYDKESEIKRIFEKIISIEDKDAEIICLCYIENRDKIQGILSLFDLVEKKI